MKLFFSIFTLTLLTVCSASPQPLYDYKSTLVHTLTAENVPSLLGHDNVLYLVNFYDSTSAAQKYLSPEWIKISKSMNHIVQMGAMDCATQRTVCAAYNVTTTPSIRLLIGTTATKIYPLKDKLKASPLIAWVHDTIPNTVKLLTMKEEKSSKRNFSLPRAILFTDKRETSPMWRSLAWALKGKMEFGEIRKNERRLLEKYEISTFPKILVEPQVPEGTNKEEVVPKMYTDAYKFEFIFSWLSLFTGEDIAAIMGLPQLSDQSCFDMHCNGLCAVLVVSNDADAKFHISKWNVMQHVRKDQPFRFVWIDALNQTDFLRAAFNIEPQTYPQVVGLSGSKHVYANYVGTFNDVDILKFLDDMSKGKVSFSSFQQADGSIPQLAGDGVACPKPQAPVKASEPGVFGRNMVLSPTKFEEVVLRSPSAWMFLFHNTSDPTQESVMSEWNRVARKTKHMVRFASFDVHTYQDVPATFEVSTFPTIKYFEPGITKSIESLQTYTNDTSALTLYNFAISLLTDTLVIRVLDGGFDRFVAAEIEGQWAPKVLLFSASEKVPEIYQALSIEYDGDFVFGQIHVSQTNLMKQFNIQQVPALFVLSLQGSEPNASGEVQMKVAATPYTGGQMSYTGLNQFLKNLQYHLREEASKMESAKQQQVDADERKRAAAAGIKEEL